MNPSGKVKFMYVEGDSLPATVDDSTFYIVSTTPKTLYIGSDLIGGSGDLKLDVTLDEDFEDNQVDIAEQDVPFVDVHPSKIAFKKFSRGLFSPFPPTNMNIVPFDNLTPTSWTGYWEETYYTPSGTAEWDLKYNTDVTNNEFNEWFYLRSIPYQPSIAAHYDVLLCDHVQDFIEDGAWIYIGCLGAYSSEISLDAYYSVVLEDANNNRIGLDHQQISYQPDGIIGFQYHSSYTKLKFELEGTRQDRNYVIAISYCAPGNTEPDIRVYDALKYVSKRTFNAYGYSSGFTMNYTLQGDDILSCYMYNDDININNFYSASVEHNYPYCYNIGGYYGLTVYANSVVVFNLSDKKLYYLPNNSSTLELASFSDEGVINIENSDGTQYDIISYNTSGLSNIYTMSSYDNILAYNPSNAEEVSGATAYCQHYNDLIQSQGSMPHYSVVYDMTQKLAYEECLFIPTYYSSLSYLIYGKSYITGSGSSTVTAGDSVMVLYSGEYVDKIHPHTIEYIDLEINGGDATRYTDDLCRAFTIYASKDPQYFSASSSDDIDLHIYAEYNKLSGVATIEYVDYEIASHQYTLPVASASTLGGVKVGDNLSIDENGVLSGAASIQASTMPTAAADLVGKVVQYIGATTADYTSGYFYECKINSDAPIPGAYVAPDGKTYKYYYRSTYSTAIVVDCYSNYPIAWIHNQNENAYYFDTAHFDANNVVASEVNTRYPYGENVMWIRGTLNGSDTRVSLVDRSYVQYPDEAHTTVPGFDTPSDAEVYINTLPYYWDPVNVQPEALPYTLPVASSSTLGGVKIGDNVNIDANGVISVASPTYINTVNSVSIGTITTETEIASFPFYPTSVGNGDALIINGIVSGLVAVTGSAAEITIKVKLDGTDYFTFKQTCNAGYVTIPVTCSIPMTSPAANHVATVTVTATDGSITL